MAPQAWYSLYNEIPRRKDWSPVLEPPFSALWYMPSTTLDCTQQSQQDLNTPPFLLGRSWNYSFSFVAPNFLIDIEKSRSRAWTKNMMRKYNLYFIFKWFSTSNFVFNKFCILSSEYHAKDKIIQCSSVSLRLLSIALSILLSPLFPIIFSSPIFLL